MGDTEKKAAILDKLYKHAKKCDICQMHFASLLMHIGGKVEKEVQSKIMV